MTRIPACVAVLFTALGVASCGAESVEAPTLKVVDGSFQGELSRSPAPSVVGENTLTLELRDENGEPLETATVVISPWMPAHGHGSRDVTADEEQPGRYVTKRLLFNMPGRWDLRVAVEVDGEEGHLLGSLEVP